MNVRRQQLEDAKALSEVHEKELFDAQVDTLSISEVSEKVTTLNLNLNDENFQAAATLGRGSTRGIMPRVYSYSPFKFRNGSVIDLSE